MTTAALCGVLFAASALAAPEPAPKPGAGTKKPSKSGLDGERLKKALSSGDEAQVLAALDELSKVKPDDKAEAGKLVDGVLVQGGNVKVLVAALDTAGKLAQSDSSTSAAPYVRHRHAEVRRAAVRALTQTGGALAVQSLRDLLRGNDASLRGLAASGLAALKAQEAVPDLFAVLPRGVPEAAGAIGELCKGDDCSRFVDLLGKLPFDLMQSGLAPIVLRTDADPGEVLKIKVVERIRGLQTQEAADLIKTLLADFPKNGSPKVKAALEAAAQNKPAPKEAP